MSLLKKNLGGIKIYLTIQMSLTFPALCCGVRAPRVRGHGKKRRLEPATWHFPRHLAFPPSPGIASDNRRITPLRPGSPTLRPHFVSRCLFRNLQLIRVRSAPFSGNSSSSLSWRKTAKRERPGHPTESSLGRRSGPAGDCASSAQTYAAFFLWATTSGEVPGKFQG